MHNEINPDAGHKAQFTVSADLDGARLDRILVTSLGLLSRERFKEMILDGFVKVAGEVDIRPSAKIAAGTLIELDATLRDRTRPGSEEGSMYQLIHEDEHILIVNKPAGMVVHPSERVRGGTLSELLAEKYPGLPTPQGEDRPGIVHRLDAETSGVLVVARTHAVGEELKRQFKEREVEKVYCALIYGELRFDSDWIEVPLGRGRGSERVTVLQVEDGGRDAATFYKTRERLGNATLVDCEPKTGRTHQIRVHLESIGHPVVGDKLYRGKRVLRIPGGRIPVDRHLLHAAKLSFCHPGTGQPVTYEAPVPGDFEEVLTKLRAAVISDED